MIFEASEFDSHEQVSFFHDRASGARFIIAIHSTHLGPALGGCRYRRYVREEDAITDVLRLSRGMSYKNALAGLAIGGGKSVILQSDTPKSDAMFEAFGEAIEGLQGRYITAEDVGIVNADMRTIARRTRYVSGLPPKDGAPGGSPSPSTARGVLYGMRAAIQHKLGRSDFRGVHVAIQGVGAVGAGLARLLQAEGARLTLADADEKRARALCSELGARFAPAEAIMTVACDILSPCALGATLNAHTIPHLKAAIIAGAANNQLATPEDGRALFARDILYAPDYVMNAGGVIALVTQMEGEKNHDVLTQRLAGIAERADAVFTRSARQNLPPNEIADAMARELIGRG